MGHASRTGQMRNMGIPYFNWDNLKKNNISWKYRWRWENNDKICLTF